MKSILITILLAVLCAAYGQTDLPNRPNILFAIADDWGYGHAGAYGCKCA